MPELPEVETVRRGLAEALVGRCVRDVTVRGSRTLRRQPGGEARFRKLIVGQRVRSVRRRGKYLWFEFTDDDALLVAHLGMSGQLLSPTGALPEHRHDRASFRFDGVELRLRDQRTFGWLLADSPAPVSTEGMDAAVPSSVAHVARDPFDPHFGWAAVAGRISASRVGIKRQLLDQSLVSGIGNIYADEALWNESIHFSTPGRVLGRAGADRLLRAARRVMSAALAAGGTTFDSFVDLNGDGGRFGRSLAVYGRETQPCPRCRTAIVRDRFANRSAFRCPRCQPGPDR